MSRPRRSPPILPMQEDRAPHGAGFVWVALGSLIVAGGIGVALFGRVDGILWGASTFAALRAIADTLSRF